MHMVVVLDKSHFSVCSHLFFIFEVKELVHEVERFFNTTMTLHTSLSAVWEYFADCFYMQVGLLFVLFRLTMSKA